MNVLSMITEDENALNQIYNTAVGKRTTLNQLVNFLKKHLSKFDTKITQVHVLNGPERAGDIPHSLASINKAKKMLNYNPTHDLEKGIKEAINWYWENLS